MKEWQIWIGIEGRVDKRKKSWEGEGRQELQLKEQTHLQLLVKHKNNDCLSSRFGLEPAATTGRIHAKVWSIYNEGGPW